MICTNIVTSTSITCNPTQQHRKSFIGNIYFSQSVTYSQSNNKYKMLSSLNISVQTTATWTKCTYTVENSHTLNTHDCRMFLLMQHHKNMYYRDSYTNTPSLEAVQSQFKLWWLDWPQQTRNNLKSMNRFQINGI